MYELVVADINTDVSASRASTEQNQIACTQLISFGSYPLAILMRHIKKHCYGGAFFCFALVTKKNLTT